MAFAADFFAARALCRRLFPPTVGVSGAMSDHRRRPPPCFRLLSPARSSAWLAFSAGVLISVRPLQAGSAEWLEMKHLWGANWAIIGGPLSGPFSVKLTTLSTQMTLSARDVIPKNWSPKATYTSGLNFA